MSQTDVKIRMPRELVWIENIRFRGFGCSACAWVFKPSDSPTGNSFDEMRVQDFSCDCALFASPVVCDFDQIFWGSQWQNPNSDRKDRSSLPPTAPRRTYVDSFKEV